MKRILLKMLLVLSLIVLVLIPVFVMVTWGAGIVLAGIFAAFMDESMNVVSPFSGFVGSPLFYAAVVAAIAALTASVLLVISCKR